MLIGKDSDSSECDILFESERAELVFHANFKVNNCEYFPDYKHTHEQWFECRDQDITEWAD